MTRSTVLFFKSLRSIIFLEPPLFSTLYIDAWRGNETCKVYLIQFYLDGEKVCCHFFEGEY